MAQDIQVVDAVRTRDHAADDRQCLRVGSRTRAVLRAARFGLPGHQTGQTTPLDRRIIGTSFPVHGPTAEWWIENQSYSQVSLFFRCFQLAVGFTLGPHWRDKQRLHHSLEAVDGELLRRFFNVALRLCASFILVAIFGGFGDW